MFTDVVGSTELITQLGDQRAHVETREHFAVLRRVLGSFGGHEVKSIGDGLMATFTSARQAALAAVAMQRAVEREQHRAQSPVRIRIGVNTGEVVADEGDYFGAAVNVAQRLCDSAAPGQTLLSDVTVALIQNRAGLRLHSAGDLELRGFAQPVGAHEVSAADDDTATPPLPALLQIEDRLPFVGRQRELAVLDREWRRAQVERQRMVTVAGEGGMGKSTLARQFVRAAATNARHVLHGRCDEEHPVAFEPVVPALSSLVERLPADVLAQLPARTLSHLSRLLPTLGTHRPPDADEEDRSRLDLLDGALALVAAAAGEGPVLWVIDDIQWADQSTLLLIRHLVTATTTMPLLIVATYREHEGTGQPSSSVVADLRAQGLETSVRLDGLDPHDVAVLVAACVGPERADDDLAKSFHQRTDGHPLFLRELLADVLDGGPAIIDDVPMGIRTIIERRVDRLGPAARQLLDAAAVTGSPFEVEVIARAVDLPRPEFLAALDAALTSHEIEELKGHPPSCAFAHDIVRDTLYSMLPAGQKAKLHGRVARALEQVYDDDLAPVVAALAYHFGLAAVTGTAREAAQYALRAGDRARQQFAYEEAAGHYRRGLQHVAGADDSRVRAEVLVGLGQTLVGLGDTAEARQSFISAAAAARLAAAPDVFARAALGAGFGGAAVSYADPELIEMLEDAESMLAAGDDRLRAEVQARLAREVFSAGDFDRADALSTRALRSASAVDDPLALTWALNARHQCLAGPDRLAARLEIQQRSVALAEEAGQADAVLASLAGLAVDHLRLGDMKSFGEAIARYDELASRVQPAPRVAWYRATFEVTRALVDGRLDDAERLAEDAKAVGERAGAYNATTNYTAQILDIRREQGRLAELGDVVAAFAASAEASESTEATDLGWIFLQAQLRAGDDRTETARLLDGVLDRLDDVRRDDFWLMTLSLGAEAAVAASHGGGVDALYRLLLPYAGRNVVLGGGVLCHGPVDRLLGLLAAASGDPSAAEQHFDAARRIAAEMGSAAIARRIERDHAVAREL